MADLLGNDIGLNYKGLLNLDTTINIPLDGTLRVVTDGEGDSSPLYLSTTAIGLGTTSIWDNTNGRLGIGTTSPAVGLDVRGSTTYTSGSLKSIVLLVDNTTAYGSTPSAGILGAGKFDSGGNIADFGGISFIKENTTDGNYASAITFYTRTSVTSPAEVMRISSAGAVTIPSSGYLALQRINNSDDSISEFVFNTVTGAMTSTLGTITGSASTPFWSMTGTWNTSGNPTALLWNITNTASGASSLLMDLQVSGTTMFKVTRAGRGIFAESIVSLSGEIQASSSGYIGFSSRSYITSPADGKLLLSNSAVNDFGLLQFGGTSSSFPALKRSTTNLQVRLADDSGYAPIDAESYKVNGNAGFTGTGIFTSFTIEGGIITAAS